MRGRCDMDLFNDFAMPPGTQRERQWLPDRLETLSAKESVALSAATEPAMGPL